VFRETHIYDQIARKKKEEEGKKWNRRMVGKNVKIGTSKIRKSRSVLK